jgi:hypothetical protein
MTATAAHGPRLDYAPTLPWRRTPLARRLLALLFLLALAAGGAVLYPRVLDQWQLLDWQGRCMAAPVPRNAVVFKAYRGGISDGGGVPFAWTKLYATISPPGLASGSTVFLQEMQTPAGKRRLVGVDIDWATMRPSFQWATMRGPSPRLHHLSLSARVIRPGAGMIQPRILSTSSHPVTIADENCRILAGVRDPADPAHFTFTYEQPGRTTLYDGWLRDDDIVDIQERTK